jgi:hypothetical protein
VRKKNRVAPVVMTDGKMVTRAPPQAAATRAKRKANSGTDLKIGHYKGKRQMRERNTRYASEGGADKRTATASSLKGVSYRTTEAGMKASVTLKRKERTSGGSAIKGWGKLADRAQIYRN